MRTLLGFSLFVLLLTSYLALDIPLSVVEISFYANEIVPDVVLEPPKDYAQVEFPGGVQAILGNILPLSEVQKQPNVAWPNCKNTFYTLALVDPDATSRQNPNISEVKHWLIGNIPGDNVEEGETLASYLPPAPPPGSGLHRYTFLIFKQPEKLVFDEPRLLNTTSAGRTLFSIYRFSQKYSLGNPVAGNFFQTQFTNEDCK